MSGLAKFVRVLGVLLLAGAIGVLIGWMKSREGELPPIALAPASNQPVLAIASVAMPETPRPATIARVPRKNKKPVAAEASPQQSVDWEQGLEDVLLSDDDINTKADRVLALIAASPPDGQVELSQHLVNLVQDDHYDGAAQLLTNASTAADVSKVLMNDLLNRDNTLKLPMLLAVAREPDHPLKDEARDLLELMTQADNGTNWDQWSATITTWLQDNP